MHVYHVSCAGSVFLFRYIMCGALLVACVLMYSWMAFITSRYFHNTADWLVAFVTASTVLGVLAYVVRNVRSPRGCRVQRRWCMIDNFPLIPAPPRSLRHFVSWIAAQTFDFPWLCGSINDDHRAGATHPLTHSPVHHPHAHTHIHPPTKHIHP